MHEHHGADRYVGRVKPRHHDEQETLPVETAGLGLQIDMRPIILINEIWIEENDPYHKQHQSSFPDKTPYEIADK